MRGRALGLTQMALPLGGAALIPVAQLLINGGVGWQSIYYSFGAFMLVALLTPAALVLRRRPEDLGLLPDGVTSEEIETAADQPKASDATTEVSWTVSQAVHNPALWLLVAAMCIGVAANGAIGFHQFAYFRDSRHCLHSSSSCGQCLRSVRRGCQRSLGFLDREGAWKSSWSRHDAHCFSHVRLLADR